MPNSFYYVMIMIKHILAGTRTVTRSKCVFASILLAALALAAVPSVSAQNSMYGHDRTWKHGRSIDANTTVPEDYLRNERDMTGASGFGHNNGIQYGGGYQVGNTYVIPSNNGGYGNTTRHSTAWLNGMGGIDSGQYDLGTVQQPIQQQQYQQQPQYNMQQMQAQQPNSGTTYTFAPKRTAARRVVKQPATVYYTNQPGGYWGSAGRSQSLIQGGSGTSYTMQGRGQY